MPKKLLTGFLKFCLGAVIWVFLRPGRAALDVVLAMFVARARQAKLAAAFLAWPSKPPKILSPQTKFQKSLL